MIKESFCCRKVCVFAKFLVTLCPQRRKGALKTIMSKSELNENRAIARLVAHEQSTGYQRAVAANIPVTYVSGTDVVCEHNGNRTVVGYVQVSEKLSTPKVYSLK